MHELKKRKLDFEKTFLYVKHNLEKTNILSIELLNLLNFENGHFFTLLPDNANLDGRHDFKSGWILPPNPIEEYYVDGVRCTYSIKNTIRHQLIPLLFNLIKSEIHFTCIMDNFNGYLKEDYPIYYADNYSLFCGEEIYFNLNSTNTSPELLLQCLRRSDVLWHSLGVFTKALLVNDLKIMSLENIKEICMQTELIMVCAYDGEGYVFWEKYQANDGKGFFEEND